MLYGEDKVQKIEWMSKGPTPMSDEDNKAVVALVQPGEVLTYLGKFKCVGPFQADIYVLVERENGRRGWVQAFEKKLLFTAG
jgi:hypothetical protein